MFFVSGINTGLISKLNINLILSNLTNSQNGFRVLGYLPQRLSGLFGCSKQDKILINSEMKRHSNSPDLTSNEIRRLYLFHEIGHKVLNILKDEDTITQYINTLDRILKDKGLCIENTSGKEFIREGFWMIEECLVQELAEFLTYYSAFKKRPNYQYRQDISGYVLTNHDFYGIFQAPTINFGKTLRGCGVRTGTNEEVLLDMIKKALNGSFPLDIINEYNQGDGYLYYDLFLTLRAMGKIKVRKYASLGVGQDILDNTNASLNLISILCKKNVDHRDYPTEGYPSIKFEAYLPRSLSYPRAWN